MEYTTLGRTGLKASVADLVAAGLAGLDCATTGAQERAVALVRQALDLGINFLDTAESYGTEASSVKLLRELREIGSLSRQKSLFRSLANKSRKRNEERS